MKDIIAQYKLFASGDKLNEIVSSEINKNVFKKRHNLTGEISYDGGIEIYNSASFVMFKPNLGPLVILNLSCSNLNAEGTESKLKMKRTDGLTFLIHYWFSLIFAVVTFGIAIYYMSVNGFDKLDPLFLPIFGLIYNYVIRLIAKGTTSYLISKVEKMLSTEKIKYKKL